ncbi:hypothetical protein ABZT06_38090, partial [Streptomyces sp. NPDC005483]|uniref:hypothetical protein n=1 Tax=Streptomyces sp. NPDC005483 TaxID=3154882 RepID=UPI0033A3A319
MISTIRSLAWGSGESPPMLADGNGSAGLGAGTHGRRRGCGDNFDKTIKVTDSQKPKGSSASMTAYTGESANG